MTHHKSTDGQKRPWSTDHSGSQSTFQSSQLLIQLLSTFTYETQALNATMYTISDISIVK